MYAALSWQQALQRHQRWLSALASFMLPMLLWCVVSVLPFVWYPKALVVNAGGVDYFQAGMLVDKDEFDQQAVAMRAQQLAAPQGRPANPIYLPAPHEVARAMFSAFTTAPDQKNAPWLHQSLWHSIQIIFWGFVISSAIAVPLGILAGHLPALGRMAEPFTDFFRYLPAPAFGALVVAIVGIYDGPKIAIIVTGTFFQQVLIVANTNR